MHDPQQLWVKQRTLPANLICEISKLFFFSTCIKTRGSVISGVCTYSCCSFLSYSSSLTLLSEETVALEVVTLCRVCRTKTAGCLKGTRHFPPVIWDSVWSFPVTPHSPPHPKSVSPTSRESETIGVTQVSLHGPLFMWMTSDSVDFHWTVRFRLRAPFFSSRLQRIPFRHLGGVAVANTLVTLCFVKRSWLSIMREKLTKPATKIVTCTHASHAFELTVFNHLRGCNRYRKWPPGLLTRWYRFVTVCGTQAEIEADWDFSLKRTLF